MLQGIHIIVIVVREHLAICNLHAYFKETMPFLQMNETYSQGIPGTCCQHCMHGRLYIIAAAIATAKTVVRQTACIMGLSACVSCAGIPRNAVSVWK